MIPIARPLIGQEEKEAVLRVLDSGMLASGKVVEQFEQEFARYIGVKHAIATSSGTTALHACLIAHGIKKGDEIITTPFSFIATANVIKMVGATPVFVDIAQDTFNINPDLIEKSITEKTKAILPVHLFGQSCDMQKIMVIANKHNIKVIEDACQAHGAKFIGQKVGSFGSGCFSFYPTKNMTTSEGGIITTNDDLIAEKVRRIIDHHSDVSEKYLHSNLGYNFRMTNICAAIGLEQLKKLDLFNETRRSNAKLLNNGLNKIKGLIIPIHTNGHIFHQYTIRLSEEFKLGREKLSLLLKEHDIGNSIFYPILISKQQAYTEFNQLSFPVAEKLAQEVLSLPVHPGVSENDVCKIITFFKDLNDLNNGDEVQ
jgi:perosamine synthetase